jgi:hypothetical protein
LKLKVIKLTPTLTVAGAYAIGDVIGTPNKASNAVDSVGGQMIIRSVSLVDAAKQNQPIDLIFFDDLPTLSNPDNGAFALTDAEMLSKCIGKISVLAADYADAAASSIASKIDLSLVLQAVHGKRDIYCVAVSRGTPTFTAGDLKILLGLEAS